MKPEIALWGWAEVKRNGQVISRMAPAHVMVSSSGECWRDAGAWRRGQVLTAEPDGYIHVMWHRMRRNATGHIWRRAVIGWIALAGIVLSSAFWRIGGPSRCGAQSRRDLWARLGRARGLDAS